MRGGGRDTPELASSYGPLPHGLSMSLSVPMSARRSVDARHPRETRIRGVAARSLLHAMTSTFGEDTTEQIVAATTGEAASLWQSRDIAASAWYPISWIREIYRATAACTGQGPDAIRALRRAAVRLDARGIFKFLLRFSTPAMLAPAAKTVGDLYLEGPTLTAKLVAPDTIRFWFENTIGYDELLWADHLGGTEAVIEASGGRNATAVSLESSADYRLLVGEVRWS